MEFKHGDIVRLKAGGPKMNVEKLHSDGGFRYMDGTCGVVREGEVSCVWFDDDNQLHRDKFPIAALLGSCN
jgi:uncharacterized protein YodC (DUF2158 family)